MTPLTKESCLRFTGSLAKAYPWLMPVSTLACPHCWHAWLSVGIMKTAFSPIRLGSMRWVTVRQSNSKNSSSCAANLHDAPIFRNPHTIVMVLMEFAHLIASSAAAEVVTAPALQCPASLELQFNQRRMAHEIHVLCKPPSQNLMHFSSLSPTP